MSEPRPEPAGEEKRLRRRPLHLDALDRRDLRPESRELVAPAARPRPRDVGHDDLVEDAGELDVRAREVRPFRAVDDQPVDDADEALELAAPERRQSTPAEEGRQVG